MSGEPDQQEIDASAAGDAADEACDKAQIEHRLQHVFRLAGDSEAVQQLMRMVCTYRLGQRQ